MRKDYIFKKRHKEIKLFRVKEKNRFIRVEIIPFYFT